MLKHFLHNLRVLFGIRGPCPSSEDGAHCEKCESICAYDEVPLYFCCACIPARWVPLGKKCSGAKRRPW